MRPKERAEGVLLEFADAAGQTGTVNIQFTKKKKKKIGARQTAFPYFYIPSLYIPPNHFFVMVLSCTPDYAFNFLPSFDGRQVSIILLVGKCCILYIITILQHFQIKAYLHSNSYYGQTKHKHQWK